jgi:signal transduction histidine kinase
MITSLKSRLIWTLSGLTLFAWLASAILTIYSAGRATEQQVDRQLEQYSHLVTYISRVFARQIDEGLPLYETWSENPLESLRERPMVVEAPEYGELSPAVNIWLNEKLIAVMAGSPEFERPTVDGFSYIDVSDGSGPWRVLTRYDEVSALWIRVGVEFERARWSLLRTLAEELLPLLVVLPLTVAAMYLGVSGGLLPLNNLAGQISRRKPGLLEPVATDDVPVEISELVASINQLMARLAHALESEQRFTANAAHELLTPLAAIKTEVQLCQRRLQNENDAAMLQGIVDRVDRAGHSVEQLLTLARLDPEAPLPATAVNIRALLVETLAETGHLAAERQLEIDLPEGDACFVEGSETALAILLRNLLINAFRYASEGTAVRIRLAVEDGFSLSICNDCAPLAPEELQRIADRFYRIPGSQGPGAGLGLSIVDRIAEQHGARFEVATRENGSVFCATVSGLSLAG